MAYPKPPLTLLEAIDQARAHGLGIELLAGFSSHTLELLVSVDTIDPEPTLSLRLNHSRTDSLLSARHQSGPERWEYPFSDTEFRDRFFLRVFGEQGFMDVPLVPAVIGIVERYGLVDDVALSTPARVDRRWFEEAIALLVQAGQRPSAAKGTW
jgi:hypothetical protein